MDSKLNSIATFDEEEVLDTINKMVNTVNNLSEKINELELPDLDERNTVELLDLNTYSTVAIIEKLNQVISRLNNEEY